MKTETILNDQYTSSSFKLKQKLYITEMNCKRKISTGSLQKLSTDLSA